MQSFSPENTVQFLLYLLHGGIIYWAYQRKKWSFCLGLILSLGFCLRFFPSLDVALHEWDERYHAIVAKNILLHPFMPTLYEHPIIPFDYTFWGGNHVWLHKQPLALWFMALSLKIFGLKAWAVRIPSVIFSTLTIGLTYTIGKRLFSKEIAFLAALLLAINPLAIEVACGRTTADHIDTLYLFWITLAIYATIRYYQEDKKVFLYLVGICLGLAILTKWLVALFVLAILATLIMYKKNIWESAKSVLVSLLWVFVIAFPWQYYIFQHYPQEAQWEFTYNQRHFSEHLEGHNAPWWIYLAWARITWNEGIYIVALWFAYIAYKNREKVNYQTLAIWIGIPYLFFTMARTRGFAYILPTMPAVVLVESLFMQAVVAWSQTKWQKIGAYVCVMALWGLSILHTIERLKPFDTFPEQQQMVQDIHTIQQVVGTQKAVVFNFYDPYQLLFFTDYVSYYACPDDYFVQLSKEKGYKIFAWDSEKISETMRHNPDIHIITRK